MHLSARSSLSPLAKYSATGKMKRFSTYIEESIISQRQDSLSPDIFEDPNAVNPKLKDDLRDEILKRMAPLVAEVKVLDYVLLGSILTLRYDENSDIDVTVLVAEKDLEKSKKITSKISGKKYKNTPYPINYFIMNDAKEYERRKTEAADASFDIKNNEFIKKPKDIKFSIELYLQDYADKVKAIDLLADRLDDVLFDYESIKNMTDADARQLKQRLKQTIEDMELNAEEISAIYDDIKTKREDAYNKTLTPEEIRTYGTNSYLPGNVIYKLLEKYHYLKLLKTVNKIISDGEISKSEIKVLKKALDDHKKLT